MAVRGYGWSVGNIDWLNSPASKVNRYWRVVEEGSNATDWPWQGQRIVGLWGPNAGPRGGLINGDLSAFQSGRSDQKFVPFFRQRGKGLEGAARAALYYYFGGGEGKNMDLIRADPSAGKYGGPGRSVEAARKRFYFWMMMVGKDHGPRLEQLPFVTGIIMREVQAGDYYARAITSFNPLEREKEKIRQLFGKDMSTPGGVKNARDYQAMDAYSSGKPVKPKTKTTAWLKKQIMANPHSAGRGSGFMYSVDMSVQVQDLRVDSRNRFHQYQGDLQAINRELAEAFQEEVVQLMQQERRRPVSGALIRATRDPRNRAVN
jgi:hypothetical protein